MQYLFCLSLVYLVYMLTLQKMLTESNCIPLPQKSVGKYCMLSINSLWLKYGCLEIHKRRKKQCFTAMGPQQLLQACEEICQGSGMLAISNISMMLIAFKYSSYSQTK